MRGAIAPLSVPISQSPADRFAALVTAALDRLERRWPAEVAPVDLQSVEVAIEDLPRTSLGQSEVPLGECRPGPTPQLVFYRRPIEHRVETMGELAEVVGDLVTELVAELFEIPPEDIDPYYG